MSHAHHLLCFSRQHQQQQQPICCKHQSTWLPILLTPLWLRSKRECLLRKLKSYSNDFQIGDKSRDGNEERKLTEDIELSTTLLPLSPIRKMKVGCQPTMSCIIYAELQTKFRGKSTPLHWLSSASDSRTMEPRLSSPTSFNNLFLRARQLVLASEDNLAP